MYDHRAIEEEWRRTWEQNSIYRTDEDSGKKKCYALVMFPYPSGSGLHVGHARVYIGADIYARMMRMRGYQVLHPMGWDAFGLPAEEYAIKNKQHPQEATARNIAVFKDQISRLGLSYDWDREINTTDPSFYKWTQWIFIQLFKKGLAYESNMPVNWCPSCKTGLANEDLDAGTCERCGSAVERKPMRQWVLRITDYADRLLDDLDTLDGWSDSVKEVQRNWIGRSDGYTIPFAIEPVGSAVDVFTTRPDTLFGCSFIAISPESTLVDTLLKHAENKEEIEVYRTRAHTAKAAETDKAQTGVLAQGIFAVHPLTKKNIPVFIADFVLGGYGTGAVFGSPAHDARDFAFAVRYNLSITQVIAGDGDLPLINTPVDAPLIHSGEYDGTPSEQAKPLLANAAGGKKITVYRLQDWVFSRQRYWGEPIPLIHCGKCGVVPVPDKDLPVTLPDVASYEPTGTVESPLAAIEEWVNAPCPQCGGAGKRETNTMPQWAGSSWYHLRYIDPHNSTVLVDSEKEKQWMPVDIYTGGMEHAARHLIYARFWHKVMLDIGVVSTAEPYAALRTVGIVQAEGGGKMSKRLGNVVDPVAVADAIGADALRVYIAHIAPFSQTVAWDSRAIAGPRRFLERVYALRDRVQDSAPNRTLLQLQHETILSVTDDIAVYRFNTAVSSLMILTNALYDADTVPKETYTALIQMLAPFAPYITEVLWRDLGHNESVHLSHFPQGNAESAQRDTVVIAVQVLGKTRGTVTVSRGSNQEIVLRSIAENTSLANRTKGLTVKVFVEDRIISFV